MTEQELLQSITDDGWEVLQTQDGEEFGYPIKQLYIGKVVNGVWTRQSTHYIRLKDGSCHWVHHSPIRPPVQETFGDKLNNRITELIQAEVIKAAYIERIDPRSETAIIVAVMPDNTFKTFLIEVVNGNLQHTELTGKYPFGSVSEA